MAYHGKRYQAAKGLIDNKKLYGFQDALSLLKNIATAKFDETVELSINLGVNPKHADQQVRSTVILPHGTGRVRRIAVFAKGDPANEAEKAGADIVGAEDLIEKIKNGFLEFDVAIATPDMMREVGFLGKILGPRGLMPNPKVGTVTFEVTRAINEIKKGKLEFRCDKFGIVHTPSGKISWEHEKLSENIKAIVLAILRAKPATVKGQYLKSISISTTMGVGIKLDPKELRKLAEEG